MSEVTFVVKRIRKRLSDGTIKEYRYVYWQERLPSGKVLTRYIGPLEEIVKAYLEKSGLMAPPGFEPGISGSEGPRPDPG